MDLPFVSVARRFWPELASLRDGPRQIGAASVLAVLYSTPLVILGTLWLIAITDVASIRQNWLAYAGLAALILIFERLPFFIVLEIRPGSFASGDSTLTGLATWSALFLFGPTVLWVPFLYQTGRLVWQMARARTKSARWERGRSYTLSHAAEILAPLAALQVYTRIGGEIPLPGLMPVHVRPAFLTILVHFVLFCAIYLVYVAYIVWAQKRSIPQLSMRRMLSFLLLVMGIPFLAYPFGILAAGVYSQNSAFTYLFFMIGMILVAFLGRRLSMVAESSRQQFRQLLQMEQLSRAIINGPPDVSHLPEVLQEHVPAMFPSGRVLIWAEPDQYLLRHPADWTPDVRHFWGWIRSQDNPAAFRADEPVPWRRDRPAHSPLVVAPIRDLQSQLVLGGLYLELQSTIQPWDPRAMQRLYPGVNALTAQISSALNKAAVYREAIENQRAAEELRLAGEIQSGFFPDQIPIGDGWDLAVTIVPARETSGDFFDFIPLENDKLGILVADVADKGMGPALFMALSRTLIRTYAVEYKLDPELVFFATNERMLDDTRTSLFVTAFFGILDQKTGMLTYSNAGHPAPILLQNDGSAAFKTLPVTGMPIGIDEDAVWEKDSVLLEAGDTLLLYTDGVLDATNEQDEFFEADRLIQAARASLGNPAHAIQAAIIDDLHSFSGQSPQFDDMTLMVLVRK